MSGDLSSLQFESRPLLLRKELLMFFSGFPVVSYDELITKYEDSIFHEQSISFRSHLTRIETQKAKVIDFCDVCLHDFHVK